MKSMTLSRSAITLMAPMPKSARLEIQHKDISQTVKNICCPPVDQLADEAVPVAVFVLVAVRLHGHDLVFNAGDLQ